MSLAGGARSRLVPRLRRALAHSLCPGLRHVDELLDRRLKVDFGQALRGQALVEHDPAALAVEAERRSARVLPQQVALEQLLVDPRAGGRHRAEAGVKEELLAALVELEVDHDRIEGERAAMRLIEPQVRDPDVGTERAHQVIAALQQHGCLRIRYTLPADAIGRAAGGSLGRIVVGGER